MFLNASGNPYDLMAGVNLRKELLDGSESHALISSLLSQAGINSHETTLQFMQYYVSQVRNMNVGYCYIKLHEPFLIYRFVLTIFTSFFGVDDLNQIKVHEMGVISRDRICTSYDLIAYINHYLRPAFMSIAQNIKPTKVADYISLFDREVTLKFNGNYWFDTVIAADVLLGFFLKTTIENGLIYVDLKPPR